MFHTKASLILLPAVVMSLSSIEFDCTKPPPVRTHPRDCCHYPRIIDDSVFRNCYEESEEFVAKPESKSYEFLGIGSYSNCISECVLNGISVLVNGSIDQNVAHTYLSRRMANHQQWLPIVTNAFKICTNEINTRQTEIRDVVNNYASSNKGKICSPVSNFIINCFYHHLICYCPANQWTETRECSFLVQYFTTCPWPIIRGD